jgi:hypothetical protein
MCETIHWLSFHLDLLLVWLDVCLVWLRMAPKCVQRAFHRDEAFRKASQRRTSSSLRDALFCSIYLNTYGAFLSFFSNRNFTRVTRGPETGAYYHPLFQRDNTNMALQMACINSKSAQQLQPMDPIALGMGVIPQPGISAIQASAATAALNVPFPPVGPPQEQGLPLLNAQLHQQEQGQKDPQQQDVLARTMHEQQQLFLQQHQQQMQTQQQSFMAQMAANQAMITNMYKSSATAGAAGGAGTGMAVQDGSSQGVAARDASLQDSPASHGVGTQQQQQMRVAMEAFNQQQQYFNMFMAQQQQMAAMQNLMQHQQQQQGPFVFPPNFIGGGGGGGIQQHGQQSQEQEGHQQQQQLLQNSRNPAAMSTQTAMSSVTGSIGSGNDSGGEDNGKPIHGSTANNNDGDLNAKEEV